MFPVQAPTTYLAGSGTIIGATSVTVTNFVDIYGNVLTISDFGGTQGQICLEPDTNNEESATFTGITVNANGTYTLTGVKTVLAKTPFTETSGLIRQHAGGQKVVISDTSWFWYQYASKAAANIFSGVNQFTQKLRVGAVTSADLGYAATVDLVNSTAIAGAPDAGAAVKGITKTSVAPVSATDPISVGDNDPRVPTQAENDAMAGTSGSPSSSNKYVTNDDTSTTAAASKVVRADSNKKIDPAYIQSFTGDGSDGALAVSSGTTNIDLGAAQVVIKQYSSVSITGTGQVTCSNPHANGTLLIIKSQGGVTMTSSTIPNFDMSGMGGTAGTGGATSSAALNQQNNGGTDATSTITNIQTDSPTSHGKGGVALAVTGGAGGTIFGNLFTYTLNNTSLSNRKITIAPGFGGGGGSGGQSQLGSSSAGAAGGRGGGALVVQCGGALNFTSALGIDVSGKNGSTASNVTTAAQTGGGGGGGGGGSGMCLILYNTLTAASGTVNATGGTGGTGSTATATAAVGSACGAGGGGGGGGTYLAAGGAGGNAGAVTGAATPGSAGSAGTLGSGGGGGGGGCSGNIGTGSGASGGAGGATSTSLWLVTKNNYFA